MTTAPQPQNPNPTPAAPAPAAVPPASPGPSVLTVSAVSVVCTVAVMALCGGAGLVVFLRPGAMAPLTAALGTAGFLVAAATPFITATLARRQH
ncbi:hypothetical protein OG233_30895 (plasmid) [Streptomyces sp. NBC_01218]|uniref:hypothetical protein n=1 Tax=Streptomyces sp. NBC_01218 TaxID=2903780 RepID=UPI002E1306FF|nr:hypothetical protein OG233_30895 [Streptomyces sp. NBC_01218]